MHGARVRREHQAAAPEQSGEHAEAHPPRQHVQMIAIRLPQLSDACLHHLLVHRSTEKSYMVATRHQPVRALGEVRIRPALRRPAGTDIERDDPRSRREIVLPDALSLLLLLFIDPHLEAAVIDSLYAHALPQYIEMSRDLMFPPRHVAERREKVERPPPDMVGD